MASQTWPVGQVPHACTLPQPSGILPQRPSQAIGLHAEHRLFSHLVPKPHDLLHAKPFPQASLTKPHPLPPPHASDCATQVLEVGLQIWPCAQVPHGRVFPQVSLISPHVMPRPAQVAGTQMATDTVPPPPSAAVFPVPAEVAPVVPPVGPPVGVLLSSVAPPWPGLLPESPPLDAGPPSVSGAIELLLLQALRRNSHVKMARDVFERFIPLPPGVIRMWAKKG